jgi:formylglycine-generating enzyme required for sulfatase activity
MSDKSAHVCRGGCWGNDPQNARFANRYGNPGDRSIALGIRLVEVVGKSSCTFRGSCSGSELEFARVTNGNFVGPGFRSDTIGIRLVEVTDD